MIDIRNMIENQNNVTNKLNKVLSEIQEEKSHKIQNQKYISNINNSENIYKNLLNNNVDKRIYNTDIPKL